MPSIFPSSILLTRKQSKVPFYIGWFSGPESSPFKGLLLGLELLISRSVWFSIDISTLLLEGSRENRPKPKVFSQFLVWFSISLVMGSLKLTSKFAEFFPVGEGLRRFDFRWGVANFGRSPSIWGEFCSKGVADDSFTLFLLLSVFTLGSVDILFKEFKLFYNKCK